jgi:hypothetical protein
VLMARQHQSSLSELPLQQGILPPEDLILVLMRNIMTWVDDDLHISGSTLLERDCGPQACFEPMSNTVSVVHYMPSAVARD